MKFGTFTFPQNPETFGIQAVCEPEYTVDEAGTINYTGMGPLCRLITGTGVFTGVYAHQNFNALTVLMATRQMMELVHPIWGTFKAYLTGLKMEQDSREGCVVYAFTFREADETGMIPRLPESMEM